MPLPIEIREVGQCNLCHDLTKVAQVHFLQFCSNCLNQVMLAFLKAPSYQPLPCSGGQDEQKDPVF